MLKQILQQNSQLQTMTTITDYNCYPYNQILVHCKGAED